MWLQGFNDVGNLILGITAKELHDLEEHDRDAAVAKVTSATGKQWNLSCRVKQETYQVHFFGHRSLGSFALRHHTHRWVCCRSKLDLDTESIGPILSTTPRKLQLSSPSSRTFRPASPFSCSRLASDFFLPPCRYRRLCLIFCFLPRFVCDSAKIFGYTSVSRICARSDSTPCYPSCILTSLWIRTIPKVFASLGALLSIR